MSLEANFLIAEEMLVARLQELPDLQLVKSIGDIETVDTDTRTLVQRLAAETMNFERTALVIFDGFTPAANVASGGAQKMLQSWIVVLMIRNARELRSGAEARRIGGVLMSKIFSLIAGWPSGNTPVAIRPFRPIPGPKPSFEPGIQMLPLSFETEITVRGHYEQ